jgi:hypothetical protein
MFSELVMTSEILIATLPKTSPVAVRRGLKAGNRFFTKLSIAVSS